ncbi:hypothetical protein [Kitasatospora sp. NPDC001527]
MSIEKDMEFRSRITFVTHSWFGLRMNHVLPRRFRLGPAARC